MKGITSVVALALVSMLLGDSVGSALAASAGKGTVNHRGGKAGERMSEKGKLNTNSQWSADPDRGWVRAEERHKMHEERDAGRDRVKQNSGKSRGKGKGNKS